MTLPLFPELIACKFCGCTQAKPCVLFDADGDVQACHWVIVGGLSQYSGIRGEGMDLKDNICSNPDCVAKGYKEAVKELRK